MCNFAEFDTFDEVEAHEKICTGEKINEDSTDYFWICEVCNIAEFDTFDEAVAHEKICTGGKINEDSTDLSTPPDDGSILMGRDELSVASDDLSHSDSSSLEIIEWTMADVFHDCIFDAVWNGLLRLDMEFEDYELSPQLERLEQTWAQLEHDRLIHASKDSTISIVDDSSSTTFDDVSSTLPDVGSILDGRDFCAEEGIERDVNIKVERLDEPKVTHAPGSNPVKLPLKDVSLTPLSVDDSPCTHESWEEPLANDMLSITSDDLSSADSSSSETSSDIEWLERLVTF